MYTDNFLAFHIIGLFVACYCLFEAWQGRFFDRSGNVSFKDAPLFFALMSGMRLGIGVILILDFNVVSKLGRLGVIPLGLACAMVMYLIAKFFHAIKTRREDSRPSPRNWEEGAVHLGPSTLAILALMLLWLGLAAVSPMLFADLTRPELTAHYIQLLVLSSICSMFWVSIGAAFLFPYRASIDGSILRLRSLKGTTEIPLSSLISVDRGFLALDFITADRRYRLVNCFSDSPEHRAKTSIFITRLIHASGRQIQ
ncbi:MAG: hypothetical protein KC777_26550 [Cyanobacteria bacterium HKST-UBA02]|nr:hypothetical protein [Cyanobacteria bacterium HKST-UBA02]